MKKLTEKLRAELKKPLGNVLSEDEAVKKLAGFVLIISVGDICSASLIKRDILPSVVVYDLKFMRMPVDRATKKILEEFNGKAETAINPAGFISDELVAHIQRAVARREGKIFVKGEEDLAALPAIIYAPAGAAVLYGQPNEGIVLIEVDEKARKNANRIVSEMEEV